MVQAICVTLIAGIFFGLSLFATEKVLFASKKPLIVTSLSTIKLLLLGRFFYIMLKSNRIHPIILVALFLGAYWLTILTIKEFVHARS